MERGNLRGGNVRCLLTCPPWKLFWHVKKKRKGGVCGGLDEWKSKRNFFWNRSKTVCARNVQRVVIEQRADWIWLLEKRVEIMLAIAAAEATSEL